MNNGRAERSEPGIMAFDGYEPALAASLETEAPGDRCSHRPVDFLGGVEITDIRPSRTFTGWIAPACGWRTYSIPFVVRTPPVDVTSARLQERLAVQPLSLCARFCWSRQDRLA